MNSLLAGITPEALQFTLQRTLPGSSLVRARFAHVARRFGVISRETAAARNPSMIRALARRMRSSPVFEEALAEVALDKLDVDSCIAAYRAICNAHGDPRVVLVSPARPSPLSESMLDFGSYRELISAAEPSEDVLKQFTEDTKAKTVNLVCTFCEKQHAASLSDDWGKAIACPFCGSTQVATEDYLQVIGELRKERAKAGWDGGKVATTKRKNRKGEEKTAGEYGANPESPTAKKFRYQRTLEEMHAVASLVGTYGLRALIALSVFGVGPDTAGRVLAKMHKSEQAFYYDLFMAQKTFIKNRSYWKS
jgi:hypothetical protein